jgi:hypothetical protein
MPGLLVHGEEVQIPGLKIINYKDDPRLALKMGEDMRMRHTRWVRAVTAHTTKGKWPQTIKPGLGPDTNLEDRIARLWATDHRHAGTCLSIDWNGDIGCHCDLILHAAYHAGIVNEVTASFELFQGGGPDWALYEGQLEVAADLTIAVCKILRIQLQMPTVGQWAPIARMEHGGGKNVVGVYAHSHVTSNRGRGDCGDHFFACLAKHGFEQFDFTKNEDLKAWKERQGALGCRHIDGIPGPETCDILQEQGCEAGLWAFPSKVEWETP